MTMFDQWCSPPHAHPALLHDEIHVWRASLAAPAADAAPGYMAAVVVEGQADNVYGWQWPHWL